MARINKLSVKSIPSLQNGSHSDGGNLYLRKNGASASWVFRYKLAGKPRELGLGSYPARGLAEARQVASRMRTELLEGEVLRPLKARGSPQEVPSFRDCALSLIDSKQAEWSNKKHGQQWRNTLETYAFPRIGSTLPSEIDVRAIVSVLEPIWVTKTETASRVRQRLEAILDWAIVHGFRAPDNPARWKNNLERILPSPAKISPVNHFRALPYVDLPAVCSELSRSDAVSSQVLLFTILTVCRSGEARGASWAEINLGAKRWVVPAHRKKERRELAIPLSAPCIDILRSRAGYRQGDLVFGLKPLSDVAVTKQLKRVAGDFTVHGLRSTFRQWSAEKTSHTENVLEKVLGHASRNQLISAYQRSDLFDLRRGVMDDWASFCLGPSQD